MSKNQMLIISIIIIYFLSFTTSENKCQDSWLRLANSNKCIFYSQRKYNFSSAQNYCKKKWNSSLIMITSKEENRQVSKILFDDLQFDEYFWLGGKIMNKRGDFRWLDSCQPVKYNNFHINNHEFNVDDHNEEYLVLTSTMNENKSKRKERGTWCSFGPSIMFYALCELPDNPDRHLTECEHKELQTLSPMKQSTIISYHNLSYVRANKALAPASSSSQEEQESSNQFSMLNITKIQAYSVIGLSLMVLLLLGLIFILKTKYSSTSNRLPENEQFEVC